MEGGGIFATKAAKCFSPLHAICALAKVGERQFYKAGILSLLPTCHSLCLERLLPRYLLQHVLLREAFPT